MRYALMIEPQQGVSWDLNVSIAQRAEAAGFETLYRSDHYESFPGPVDQGSTDAWATIAGLVRETTSLRHGTMVSPVTFRHPGNIAKVVATIDEMSGGRVELGLGAGWHRDEHRRLGLGFPDLETRIEMMEEQIQIVGGLWSGEAGWSFAGHHYVVGDSIYMPLPRQQPRPPLILGVKGAPRGLRAAARWADHLNLYDVDPERAAAVFKRFDEVCAAEGRDPSDIVRSVLIGTAIGADRAEAEQRADAMASLFEHDSTTAWKRESAGAWAIGTPDEALEKVREYEAAGVELVVLQDLLPEDLAYVDLLGALAQEWG